MLIWTGKNVIKIAGLFVIISAFTESSSASSSSNLKRAEASFEAYVKARQLESEQEAKKFWNKEEIEKYVMYDWQWGYLSFRKLNPLYLNYKITDAAEKDGYVVLQIEWYYREGKAGPIQKDIRYFVEEDGRMVGANAIFVHTQNWHQKNSRHFTYHFKRNQDMPDRTLLKRMDRLYEKMVDFLQVDYTHRIDYFKCDSAFEVGMLFDMEPSLARSQIINGVVASIREFVSHEVVHILSYRMLPQNEKRLPPSYLDEGLAYYLGGASFFSPESLLSLAKTEFESPENVSLDRLIRDPWVYGGNRGASLLSSLAKFLIETKGIFKFKQLFSAGETYDEQKLAIKEIYVKSIDQLQADWKIFVLTSASKKQK